MTLGDLGRIHAGGADRLASAGLLLRLVERRPRGLDVVEAGTRSSVDGGRGRNRRFQGPAVRGVAELDA